MPECARCGVQFEILDPANVGVQKFCSQVCSKRARKNRTQNRSRIRKRLTTVAEGVTRMQCPRPDKRSFDDHAEASKEAARLGLEEYRCLCGALHIGHPSPERVARREQGDWRW